MSTIYNKLEFVSDTKWFIIAKVLAFDANVSWHYKKRKMWKYQQFLSIKQKINNV